MHIEPSQPEQGRSNFKDNTGEVSSMLLTPSHRTKCEHTWTPGRTQKASSMQNPIQPKAAGSKACIQSRTHEIKWKKYQALAVL